MKKVICYFFILLELLSCTFVYADDTAKSTIVMDMDSGRILYEKNKDTPLLIASTTKIMTAVLAIENKNLEDIVTVGDEILTMYGSNVYLEVGEKITLRDLLYGLMLRSGNDAAVTIATYVGGDIDTFVKMMNDKAKKIGMNHTIFKNPHGLDDDTENYSTAYDMAKLMKYANTLMEFVEISGTKKWTVTTNKKSYIWFNRNKMITNYKYSTGGKTGYTPRAGRTLVTTASKNNLNLIAVSLNDYNHYKTQEELLDYYFSKYKSFLIIDKNNINIQNDNFDELYVNFSFSYPLTDKEKESIEKHVIFYNLDDYKDNEIVGEIYILFNKEEIYRENIYAKKNIDKKTSIFTLIKNFFHSLL